MTKAHPSRREILKLSAAAGIAPGFVGATVAAEDRSVLRSSDAPVWNLIFLVADGMSAGVPALADAFSKLTREHETHYRKLLRMPTTAIGVVDMASADTMVTDSAAAASAWGSGQLVNNNAINVTPDGSRGSPIAATARAAGKRIGLVSTTRVTDATLAGFSAIADSRYHEDDIAAQYLEVADVILGGGQKHFDADGRDDKTKLVDRFADSGFAIVSDRAELLNRAKGGRVIGLFETNHLRWAIDRAPEEQLHNTIPTLPEMVAAALELLTPAEQGFILIVEAARVDHAAHANDAAAMLHEMLEFDDALGQCLEFQRGRDDTLLIVTTDHGCGNPGLMGFGPAYTGSNQKFAMLAQATGSYEAIHARVNRHLNSNEPAHPTDVIEAVAQFTGIELTEAQARAVAGSLSNPDPHELNAQHAKSPGMLGQALGQHTGIGWTGTSHTSDWVNLIAIGPGADAFGGHYRAVDVHARLLAALDLKPRD